MSRGSPNPPPEAGAPRPLALFFALPDGGGRDFRQALNSTHGLCLTEALGAFALPQIYALRSEGTESEFNAFAASRALSSAFERAPGLRQSWQENLHRFLVETSARIGADEVAGAVLDVFPGNFFAPTELASILPDAVAIILRPDPLSMLALAFEASGRSAVRLKDAEARYRQLHSGPQLIAEALAAFAGRSLILDHETLLSGPHQALDQVSAFLGLNTAATDFSADLDPRSDWRALVENEDFVTLARFYLKHLEPVAEALSLDCAEKLNTLETSRVIAMTEARFAHFGLNRLVALGVERDVLVAILMNNPCHQKDKARHELSGLANQHGEALFSNGMHEPAEQAITLALELDPESSRVLNNLGVLAWQRDDRALAIDFFSRAYAASHDDRSALLNLVEALIGNGEAARVRPLLAHYLALHPEDEELFALSLTL